MTDEQTKKANESNSAIQREKIKAIYPHIVVSGKKPYYSIHWYDLKQKTMICGFSSYKLNLVRKWLQEEFEVVDYDIDNLIKRYEIDMFVLEASIEGVREANAILREHIGALEAEIERLKETYGCYPVWNVPCENVFVLSMTLDDYEDFNEDY